jgi:nickel/cobalt exporter
MPEVRRQGLLPLVLALAAVLLWIAPALAQNEAPKKPPFGLAPPSVERSAPVPQVTPSKATEPHDRLTRLWLWVVEGQRELTQAMTGAVRRLKTGDFVTSTAVLAAISFLYGVLHAVGPGHGKFVISSYALANERTVRRGVVLSFMAALIQALSAVLIVGLLAAVLQATSLEIRTTEAWLETASWGLIALLGAWLLFTQVKPLLHPRRAAAAKGGCDGGHPHDPRHSERSWFVAAPGDEHTLHHHEACCGHAHVAMPSQLEGTWSWTKAWSLALSIGIRPCTGAIAVLLFALTIGLFWAGVFATIAMALGTAITVSTLVALAVGSRQLATRMAGAESRWAARIQMAAGIGGSALVFMLGAAFFIASLHGAGPL